MNIRFLHVLGQVHIPAQLLHSTKLVPELRSAGDNVLILVLCLVKLVAITAIALTTTTTVGSVYDPLLGHNGESAPLGLRVLRGVLTTRSQQQVRRLCVCITKQPASATRAPDTTCWQAYPGRDTLADGPTGCCDQVNHGLALHGRACACDTDHDALQASGDARRLFIFFFVVVVVVVSAIVAITIGIRAGTVHHPLLSHNGETAPLGLRVFGGVLTTRSQQQVRRL